MPFPLFFSPPTSSLPNVSPCLTPPYHIPPPFSSSLPKPVPTSPYPNPSPTLHPTPTHPQPYSFPTLPPQYSLPSSPYTFPETTQYHTWSRIFINSENTRANWSILRIDSKHVSEWFYMTKGIHQGCPTSPSFSFVQ